VSSWLEREWQRLGGGALLLFPFAILFRCIVAVRRALDAAGFPEAVVAPSA